jgi:hypothetical protein
MTDLLPPILSLLAFASPLALRPVLFALKRLWSFDLEVKASREWQRVDLLEAEAQVNRLASAGAQPEPVDEEPTKPGARAMWENRS